MTRNLTEGDYLLATEIADDWSKDIKPSDLHPIATQIIEARAKGFDQAFKAIIKTLSETVPE